MLDLNDQNTNGHIDGNISNNGEGVSNCQVENYIALTVTNVPEALFADQDIKGKFERLFWTDNDNIKFSYWRNFEKVRVIFNNKVNAELARQQLHNFSFAGKHLKIQITEIPKVSDESRYLRPPKADKQYLLSPPASPPVDWAPITEGAPHVDYQVLTALADLGPGQEHELHKGTDTTPSVVVFCCDEEDENNPKSVITPSLKAIPFRTKRPDTVK